MAKKITSAKEKILLDIAKRLKDDNSFYYDKPIERIKEILAEPHLEWQKRASITSELDMITEYLAMKVTSYIADNTEEGWRDLKRTLLYFIWNKKIWFRVIDFWPGKSKIRPGAYGLVEQYSRYAAILLPVFPETGKEILKVLDESRSNQQLEWEKGHHYPIFLVRLYRKLVGKEDLTGTEMGFLDRKWEHPYNDVLDNWNDESGLATAILKMCDYHVAHTKYGKTKGHGNEFPHPIHCLNPVEIHALEYVRRQLGLPTPKVEHELLELPFYPIPDSLDSWTEENILAQDALLRDIVDRNKNWCDGLEE